MPEVTPSDVIRIFLLAENRLLREALVRILAKKSDVNVVGAFAFAPPVFGDLVASRAPVVLLDSANLAFHGPHLVANIRSRMPGTRVVMIGMEREEATFLRAVREGVMGYVLQDASPLEIVNVIRAVGCGEAVYPPCCSAAILRLAEQQLLSMSELAGCLTTGLSRREQQLVGLVQLGLTNKEIGVRLNLAERTIKNHLYRIFRRIGVSDRMTMVERLCTSSETKIAV